MQAVYLLSPTAASVELLLADYEDGAEPVYGGPAHVVFTRRLPEHLLARLKECAPLVRRARSLIEANFDFVALQARWRAIRRRRAIRGALFSESPPSPPQRRVFSLDAPDALGALYGPSSRDDRDEAIGCSPSSWRRSAPPSAPSVRRRHGSAPGGARVRRIAHIELAKAAAGEDEHKRGGVARSSCSSAEWI